MYPEFDLNDIRFTVLDPYHVSADTSKTFSVAGYSEVMPPWLPWKDNFSP